MALGALADGAHIAQNAETLKQWQWSYKAFPGANPVTKNYSFLLNSLSIGVTDNLEFGVVPTAWNSSKDYSLKNFNLRYVLFRNSFWTLSTGVQMLLYEASTETQDYSFDVSSNVSTGLLANTFVLNRDWRITHNLATRSSVTTIKTTYRGSGPAPFIMDFPHFSEVYADNYLDLIYTKSITNVWAFGISRTTESILGISIPDAITTWGLGISHTWNLRNSWLTQINLGLHYMDIGSSKLLFGLAF